MPPAPRVLLLRHDRIGDAIVSTPVFSLLRSRYPDATIDVVLSEKNRAVASMLPAVDATFVLPSHPGEARRAVRDLRARKYDVVVNLLAGDSATATLLTVRSGARVRIGFAGDLASIYDYPIPRPTELMHIVRVTSLLLGPFGIDPIGESPQRVEEHERLRLPGSDRSSPCPRHDPLRIVLSVSAPAEARRWPFAQFRDLARTLRADGLDVAIAATPDDAQAAAAAARDAGVSVLPPTESFPAFVKSLTDFDLVVTPQTSTVHVASALGLPTVLLNTDSPSDAVWRPWGVPNRILSAGPTVSSISLEETLAAVRDLVREISPRASAEHP